MKTQGITCNKCRHLYVTWDKAFPYGCRTMGFKSKNLPSIFVYQASAMACQRFEKKAKKSSA